MHDIRDLLEYIEPSSLNYQEWLNVGMALKHEGYTAFDWDKWSIKDTKRYRVGECFTKWDTFQGTGFPVTGGTIVQMAKDNGWSASTSDSSELDWNSTIDKEFAIIDKNWIEGKEIVEPEKWDAASELIKYLEVLFDSTDNVGYVTKSWEKDGKHVPSKGCWDRTAGKLIQELSKCKGDIGSVLGDYNEETGAWIRFNPFDGKGIKNENVAEFRYALVESDSMDIEKQNAILRELELPIACLVHSGKKSLHAIVKVDAYSYDEYRKRVDYLYNVCKKNGLDIDSQNRNPSRLSRMPGVVRNGRKQFLIDTNIGKNNWDEWHEWIEGINDDLPEPEGLNSVWDNLPELSPSLIDGILRQGHKMLIAGPSKAGKSFALIELCIAIAEGEKWVGFNCTKGKVLYVNLELDRASCLHRFKDVYKGLNVSPENLSNIDIWNLRGKSIPMDKLAPKLIRRAAKKNYLGIVIDPIYKVITGDENSADQMANFCNQFDKVCTELGCAVIYCHHHSKGSQGSKRSMDRASGSGVFARDPDALLDLIELETTEPLIKQETNKKIAKLCEMELEKIGKENILSQDDLCNHLTMIDICNTHLSANEFTKLNEQINTVRKSVNSLSAWRIEGTLREFPKFHPLNLWFDYPIHKVDYIGSLKDVNPDDVKADSWRNNFTKKKDPDATKKEKKKFLEIAFNEVNEDGSTTLKQLAEYLGKSEKTARRLVQESEIYQIKEGLITQKK